MKKSICFMSLALVLLAGCAGKSSESGVHLHAGNNQKSLTDSDSITQCKTTSAYLQEYDIIMERMHHEMAAVKPGSNDDVNFLKQMIPHHQGAIDMSEAILKTTTDRRIINVARGIITEQRYEIELMQTLIKQLEYDSLNKSLYENK